MPLLVRSCHYPSADTSPRPGASDIRRLQTHLVPKPSHSLAICQRSQGKMSFRRPLPRFVVSLALHTILFVVACCCIVTADDTRPTAPPIPTVGGLGGFTCEVHANGGCFIDAADSDLFDLALGPMKVATQQECAGLCAMLGLGMSGVEGADQCFCGSEWNPSAPVQEVPLDQCDMACPGNASQHCGGLGRILILSANCTKNAPRFHACLGNNASKLGFCNTSLGTSEVSRCRGHGLGG